MGFAATTYLAIGVGTALAGTAMSAYSQYEQGKSQQRWSEYNAAIAERDAESARQSAEYEAGLTRKEKEKTLARQRALYGKAGVTLEGSPLEMMAETAGEYEMDALMIERGGKLESQRYRSEAQLSRMKGSAAKRAGYYGAGSTLLTGMGKAGTAYGSLKK